MDEDWLQFDREVASDRIRVTPTRGTRRAAADRDQGGVVGVADHWADPLATRGLRLVDLDLRRPIHTAFNTDCDAQQRRFDKMAGDRQGP